MNKNKKKKICLVVANCIPGGVINATLSLAELLTNQNYVVYLSVLNHRTRPIIIPAGVIYFSYFDFLDNLKKIKIIKALSFFHYYDVVIYQDLAFPSITLKRNLFYFGKKKYYYDHGAPLIDFKKNEWCKNVKLFSNKHYGIIAETNDKKSDLFNIFGKNCKYFCIPNSISNFDSYCNYNCHSKKILILARLAKEKGVDLAILSFLSISKQYPSWKLEIYGDGPEMQALTLLSKNNDNIHFHGFIDRKNISYSEFSFIIIPSRSEGFGLSTLEAKVSGLPAVCFDIPYGNKALLTDGFDSLKAKPFDTVSMARCIKKMIENPNMRKYMSKNAHENSKRFSVDNIALMWNELVENQR